VPERSQRLPKAPDSTIVSREPGAYRDQAGMKTNHRSRTRKLRVSSTNRPTSAAAGPFPLPFGPRSRRRLRPARRRKTRGRRIFPGGPSSALYEWKRPARARLPILPSRHGSVLSATRGLTSEFGTGSGDPPLSGHARAGRSSLSGTLAAAQRPSRRSEASTCLDFYMSEELGRLVALA
jgi:hypothetical protein